MLTIDCDRLALQAGMRVLDAGCGQGRHSLELLRRGCRPCAVDLNAADLRYTRYLLVDLARTPVYLSHAGSRLAELAVPISAAGLGCLVGTLWGERLLARVSAEGYRRLVGSGVAAVGLWLLARAL